jgi:hypothetical protein
MRKNSKSNLHIKQTVNGSLFLVCGRLGTLSREWLIIFGLWNWSAFPYIIVKTASIGR